ncbi:MAG: hypothetical protein ANABAC_3012 [Anaerolineae bacterium]|nr:MAG: hypothetical protein ANABAC_3012 [Anaerolineae bacterium]
MSESQAQPLASSKPYAPPDFVLELDLECRAGSSLSLPELEEIIEE